MTERNDWAEVAEAIKIAAADLKETRARIRDLPRDTPLRHELEVIVDNAGTTVGRVLVIFVALGEIARELGVTTHPDVPLH